MMPETHPDAVDVDGPPVTEVRFPRGIDTLWGRFTEMQRDDGVRDIESTLELCPLLRVRMTPEASSRMVEIGRTPADWDPSEGGQRLADAGEPGRYLLVTGHGGRVTNYRYLDAEDITGVAIRQGEELRLANNDIRKRFVGVRGQVNSVELYSRGWAG